MSLKQGIVLALACFWCTRLSASSLILSADELSWIDSTTTSAGYHSLSLGTSDAKKRITIELAPELAQDTYYLSALRSCESYAFWVKTFKQGSLNVYTYPDAVPAADGLSPTVYARVSTKSRFTIQCIVSH